MEPETSNIGYLDPLVAEPSGFHELRHSAESRKKGGHRKQSGNPKTREGLLKGLLEGFLWNLAGKGHCSPRHESQSVLKDCFFFEELVAQMVASGVAIACTVAVALSGSG